MNTHAAPSLAAVEAAVSAPRKTWHAPAIEDADINSLTNGTGTSGMEGTSFLKVGS